MLAGPGRARAGIVKKLTQIIFQKGIDKLICLCYNISVRKREEHKTMTIAQSIQYAVEVALGDKASASVKKG